MKSEPVLRQWLRSGSLEGATVVVLALGVVRLAVIESLGGTRLGLVALAVGMTAVATLLKGVTIPYSDRLSVLVHAFGSERICGEVTGGDEVQYASTLVISCGK